MNNTNFKAVKVPFATKKYYSSKSTSKSNKYKIWGYAYYIYDPLTGNIGKQFLQIKDAEYRPTDEKMQNTSYFKNMLNYSRKFREDYLSNFQSDYNSKLNYQIKSLNNKEIIEFNKLSFKYFNKVKRNFDLLTGSNSAGSIGDNKKVEFKYYNFEIKKPFEDEFNLHNFADFFNTRAKFKHSELGEIKLEDIEIITLNDYLDIFKDKQSNEIFNSTRKVFKSFNYFIINNPNEAEEIAKKIEDFPKEKYFDKSYKNIKKNLRDKKYIEQQINETIDQYENDNINDLESDKKFKNILRSRQKDLIRIEFNEFKKNNLINQNISSHLLEGEYSGQEHSHIISVQKCFMKKDYYSIADANNCLLIPGEYHKFITNNKATFNPEGDLVDVELKIISDIKIAKEFLNQDRIKFLEKNYQNWKEYKENV